MTVLDNIREAVEKIEKAKMIIFVHPHMEERVQRVIDVNGYPSFYEVVASPSMPEDRIISMPKHFDFEKPELMYV